MDIFVINRSYISRGHSSFPSEMTKLEERGRKREEEKEKGGLLLGCVCEQNPIFDEERVIRTNSTMNRDKNAT